VNSLVALFLAQVGAQNMGAVTGIVRGTKGMPAAGIRVCAMTVRDAAEAAKGYLIKSIGGSTEVPLFTQVAAPGQNPAAVGVLPAVSAPITITIGPR